ncbi:MAG: mechanosensitive ion channel domain-containing protein, partial [Planctomycetota bacterium]
MNRWIIAAVLAGLFFGGRGAAQSPDPRVAVAEARLELLGEDKPEVESGYREALALLGLIEDAREREAALREAAEDADARLEAIRAELAEPVPQVPDLGTESMTTPEISSSRDRVSAELEKAKDELATLGTEADRRQARRTEIAQRLTEIDTELDAHRAEREAADHEADPELRAAEDFLLGVRLDSLAAERDALQAEIESYEERLELLPARRDLATRRVQMLQALSDAWQQALANARQQESMQTARDTAAVLQRIAGEHPELAPLAQEIRDLTQRLTKQNNAGGRLRLAADQLDAAEGELDTLRAQYRAVRRRMEASGLNRATGLLLRRQYQSLPDIRVLEQRVRSVDRTLEDTELALVELQEAREMAGDLDAAVDAALVGVAESEQLRAAARELAVLRRDLLDRSIARTVEDQQTLTELNAVSREVLAAARAYAEFVRERILWVRSVSAGDRPTGEHVADAVGFFADAAAWRQSIRNAWLEVARSPVPPVLMGLLVAALWILRSRSGRIRARIAERVRRFRTDAVSLSFASLGLACLAGSAPSLLLWALGRALSVPVDQPLLAVSVGTALQTLAVVLFPIMILRELLAPGGLADAHFRWPERAVARLRRNITLFAVVALPAIAVTVAVDVYGNDGVINTIGRLGFTLSMVAAAWFIAATLRPAGPVLGAWFHEHQKAWATRLGRVWFGLLLLTPALLVLLTWLGYFYTALQLQDRVRLTGIVIVVLILINAMLNRWLFVARRRVAFEDAKRRRDQAIKDREESPDADTPTEAAPIDEMKIDIPAISEQTKQLFRTALFVAGAASLFVVWSPVLPALRQLDRIQLYPTIQYVEASDTDIIPELETRTGEPRASAAAPTTEAPEARPAPDATPDATLGLTGAVETEPAAQTELAAISVADVGLAAIILAITVIAFRNLPAVFEILLLQRLPLDAGTRYAISTVIRYAIAIVGISVAAAALNLSWSNIQWLAAALTFGLAFGLQEIFANFVSGLIILAERPIRLGDTVTVGEVSGTVTRIKMRATTVTDWDRKELIIPNRSFITDQVINWTLSDPVLRLTIPVGVGYNEDIRLAERILLRVADEQPVVLDTPKPHVMFGSFGDSTLDFQLRVFIPSIDHLIAVRHDMHMRVAEAFREADIEIAFPQRDITVRNAAELFGVSRVG